MTEVATPDSLGGRYDSKGNGHLDVNAQAELVRLIFDKYLELRSAP